MSLLEGGVGALASASGTSAIFSTIVNLAKQGDEIVSANNLYGGTFTLFNDILPQFGITTRFVKPQDFDKMEAAVNGRTRALYVEAIGNPALDVADLDAVSAIAKRHGLPLVVDATFATPYLLRPFEHGADIVVHSLTKWLGGHGTALGGIVVDGGTFDWTDSRFSLYVEPDASYHYLRWGYDLPEGYPPFITRMQLVPLRNLGACISPDNAWMILQGLETLPLRMERHCAQCAEGRLSSQAAPESGVGPLPGAARRSRPCRGLPYAAQRVRGHGRFRDSGRPACWPAVHRKTRPLFASRQRGRCQEPCAPSSEHKSRAAQRRTAA